MSVTTLKKLSATALVFILLFTNNAGASELRLGMAKKQQYIENKIQSTLHPASDFKPYKFEATEGWTLEKLTLNNVDVERLKAEHPKTDRVILQFHGGGYTNGLTEGHRLLGAKQGMLIGASEVYYVHYRLAPKNVYPAALDDAVAVYKELLSSGIKPENIIFIGDSAGGNLALELSLYLKENGLSQPAALALISPWGTFEQNAASRIKNRDRDLVLGSKGFPLYREVQVIKPSYAGDMELNDPKLSPIYADLRGLPPMLIQVGGYELFVDDGLSLLNRALSDDVEATLTTYPGMPHDFPLLLPELYETELSLKEFRDFVERYL
ncbi:MAG: alpha/beta hydrolase [Synergistaceae bacterium]|nr:alpha/beta hydrolase [Synergistaceae bacterium]